MSKELKYSDGSVSYVKELETKVRQQQAEIEALKDEREILFGFVKSRGEIGQLIIYKASCEAQEK